MLYSQAWPGQLAKPPDRGLSPDVLYSTSNDMTKTEISSSESSPFVTLFTWKGYAFYDKARSRAWAKNLGQQLGCLKPALCRSGIMLVSNHGEGTIYTQLGLHFSVPCKNNGTCVDTAGGYQCTCPENWSGNNCDKSDKSICGCEVNVFFFMGGSLASWILVYLLLFSMEHHKRVSINAPPQKETMIMCFWARIEVNS